MDAAGPDTVDDAGPDIVDDSISTKIGKYVFKYCEIITIFCVLSEINLI